MAKRNCRAIERRKWTLTSIVLAGILVFASGHSHAASWTVIDAQRFSDWETTHNRNNRTGLHFCASETTGADGSAFRINFYKLGEGAFIEFFNEGWSLMKGSAQISLDFDDGVRLSLRGKAWQNSYTYDLVEEQKMLVIFGLLSKNAGVRLTNANGEPLSKFKLLGVSASLRALKACLEQDDTQAEK